MKYDVAIVGAGPAGYFCAYELAIKNPNLKVILIKHNTKGIFSKALYNYYNLINS